MNLHFVSKVTPEYSQGIKFVLFLTSHWTQNLQHPKNRAPLGEVVTKLDWTGQNGDKDIVIFSPPNLASKCLQRLYA